MIKYPPLPRVGGRAHDKTNNGKNSSKWPVRTSYVPGNVHISSHLILTKPSEVGTIRDPILQRVKQLRQAKSLTPRLHTNMQWGPDPTAHVHLHHPVSRAGL